MRTKPGRSSSRAASRSQSVAMPGPGFEEIRVASAGLVDKGTGFSVAFCSL